MNAAQEAVSHKQLTVPNDLGQDASVEITGELKALLADVFTLYIKTKNFHWHMTGRHFRDYHLLLDEQAEQIFAMEPPAPRSGMFATHRLYGEFSCGPEQRCSLPVH